MATDDTTTADESLLSYTERVETSAYISTETWDRIVTFAAIKDSVHVIWSNTLKNRQTADDSVHSVHLSELNNQLECE